MPWQIIQIKILRGYLQSTLKTLVIKYTLAKHAKSYMDLFLLPLFHTDNGLKYLIINHTKKIRYILMKI